MGSASVWERLCPLPYSGLSLGLCVIGGDIYVLNQGLRPTSSGHFTPSVAAPLNPPYLLSQVLPLHVSRLHVYAYVPASAFSLNSI